MGLYFLNISVDALDVNPEHLPEDLSYNDQESIVEILVEKVLGFEDAIDEYDDYDSDGFNKKKSISFEIVLSILEPSQTLDSFLLGQKHNFPFYLNVPYDGISDIDAPPPKV